MPVSVGQWSLAGDRGKDVNLNKKSRTRVLNGNGGPSCGIRLLTPFHSRSTGIRPANAGECGHGGSPIRFEKTCGPVRNTF